MARILVIDDESNIRTMLKLALTAVGHAVETAADGFEGLERFGSGADWELTLLDQRMPGMEGLEVLRTMRQRRPDARVMMITAFGTIDLATEAMAAGAVDFLRKPFTVETLRGAVTTALTGRDERAGSRFFSPYSFDVTTVNGFRLRAISAPRKTKEGQMDVSFLVLTATGDGLPCLVSLPPYMIELVKAYADREEMPDGDDFWQALCAETLANWLWQHAELPPAGVLTVNDLTSGQKHWIDAVLSAPNAVGGNR
ncbi:MAG: response regulator [Capsulimonadales bacterium]|nr:response regulator [Capsulimonadales bacterium]